MNWCTAVEVEKAPFSISHLNRVLCSGSCFSDNIGKKLHESKFRVLSNPFGTVYNPISIFEQLCQKTLNERLFAQNQGVWSHFGFHSRFNHTQKDSLRSALLEVMAAKADFSPDVIILTFGTAWVYEREGLLVANCHKFPAKEFTKRLLEVEEIVEGFERFYSQIQARVILTLSPVRHSREGFEGNAVSKAVLRLAIDKIRKKWPVAYFPSYEIVLDELRDYRFYAEDLLHPSAAAVELLWERFAKAYFEPDTLALIKKIRALQQQLAHRPLLFGSPEHLDFLLKLKSQMQELGTLDWEQELMDLESRLTMLRQG
jgi:lysophospholipase L1-like esterase